MRHLASLLMSGAVLGTGGMSAALAADYRTAPPPMVQAMPVMAQPMPVYEDAGGWYLRGDVGVGLNSARAFSYDNYAGQVSSYGPFDITTSYLFGVGIGYTWNSWLRTDLTLEYRTGASYTGHDTYPAGTNYAAGTNTITTSMSSLLTLANVYADLMTWNCFTPYLGVGVGLSYNILGQVNDRGWNTAGASSGGTGPGGGNGSFAWALMAGVSYEVSSRMKIDFGYRYLNYGFFKASGKLECSFDPNCNPAIFKTENMDAHEFRLGLRYALGGGFGGGYSSGYGSGYGGGYAAASAAPVYAPAPAPAPVYAPQPAPVYTQPQAQVYAPQPAPVYAQPQAPVYAQPQQQVYAQPQQSAPVYAEPRYRKY